MRLIFVVLAMLCLRAPAMAADMNQSNWSEIDGLNNTSPPNGWPTAMPPNQTEATNRAVMGANKRFYDHINATQISTGTANAQVLTYPQAPVAIVAGDVYTFVVGPGLTNTGNTTLSVNGLGPYPVAILGFLLAGGELNAGGIVTVTFDGTAFEITNGGGSILAIGGTPGEISISGPVNAPIIGFPNNQLGLFPTITWSGALPTAPANEGFSLFETLGGASTAPAPAGLTGNEISITDGMNAGVGNSLAAFAVSDAISAGALGYRDAGYFSVSALTKPLDSGVATSEPGYAGVHSDDFASVNVGGTSPTFAGSAGELTGYAGNVVLQSGATNWGSLKGAEFDVSALAGSSAVRKWGLALTEANGDAVQGTSVDAALFIGNQIGATSGWLCGICFSQNGGTGAVFPMASTGTMIGTVGSGGGNAANGIDFSGVSFSGGAFKTRGASIDGVGNIGASRIQLTPIATAQLPTCGGVGSEGMEYAVTDSNSVTFNATFTGGGTSHVIAYCNGSFWTVH